MPENIEMTQQTNDSGLISPAFNELLSALYEGPMEAVPWQTFLDLLREQMAAAAATLILQPPSSGKQGVMLNVGGQLDLVASYNEKLFALDPFVDLPAGKVMTLREFVASETLENSDFYRLTLQPSGFYDILGADFSISGQLSGRLRVSRSKGAREFSQQDKALVAGLLPHLERAIRIHSKFNRIESERALYAGAIAHLSVATIILDEIGQVMNLNETAQKLLNHENGLWLERGRLCLQSDSETQALQAAIDNSLAKQKAAEPCVVEAFRVRRNNNEPDLGVIIRPVPVTEWSEGAEVPTLAVFISDPSQQAEAPVQVITQLFGLTPAEANLSMLLANGLTLEEAAVELGISRNTARTHLRSVFGKTGVSRQTLLVRLILKSVAPLAVAEG